MTILLLLVASPFLIGLYAYAIYPALLRLLARRPGVVGPDGALREWPLVSVSLPARNEARQIRGALDALLATEYPLERLQVLVISDASDDGMDDIVATYADRGVELLRVEQRGGKTAAEQAAFDYLRGDIIINTDASIRIQPAAIPALVRQFIDPTVGVASGRDISVSATVGDANLAEGSYVGYEMTIRSLETRVDGIVGSSGCLYAIRAELHRHWLPNQLSRDFASALVAREHGYRSVSVDDALCLVPRTTSLSREYRRKVRTITRGMQTLIHKRHLLNPFRFGVFAWMLWSHKVARWAVPPAFVLGAVAVAALALESAWARALLAAALVVGPVLAWFLHHPERAPRLVNTLLSAAAANVAVVHALIHAPFENSPIWEPTRRETHAVSEPRC